MRVAAVRRRSCSVQSLMRQRSSSDALAFDQPDNPPSPPPKTSSWFESRAGSPPLNRCLYFQLLAVRGASYPSAKRSRSRSRSDHRCIAALPAHRCDCRRARPILPDKSREDVSWVRFGLLPFGSGFF
jgi:hypothetical protein